MLTLKVCVGAGKAEMVAKVVEGPNQGLSLPSQLVKPTSGQVFWFLDVPAAAQLTKASL